MYLHFYEESAGLVEEGSCPDIICNISMTAEPRDESPDYKLKETVDINFLSEDLSESERALFQYLIIEFRSDDYVESMLRFIERLLAGLYSKHWRKKHLKHSE